MRAHGIIATGPTLTSAYEVADLVEGTAQIAYLTATLGISLEESVEAVFRPVAQSVKP